jgi:hypothetical protein
MATSFKIGSPVYWVEDVYDRSVRVNELHRRKAPSKQVKTGRLSVSSGTPPRDAVLTLISEEDYTKGLPDEKESNNNSNNNSENSSNEYKRWLQKYPHTMRGGNKRRVRKTRRQRI